MGLGHRRSSGQAESCPDESDAKRRTNRLSKPLTNKSTTNLALLAIQDQGLKSNNASTDALPGDAPLSPKSSDLETRREIKTHVFDGELCKDPAKPANEGAWSGVALMVSKFEATNTSQQSLTESAPKARRPFSNMFGNRRISGIRRPSLTSESSKDKLGSLKTDESPATSSEKVVDSPVYPSSRRASFQPGTATRRSSGIESVKETAYPMSSPKFEPSIIEEEVVDDDDAHSYDEGDDEVWSPPARIARTETPNSMDYTHLGGLRLGTLHVVNGRASPAPSESSRQLLARVLISRHASSEYGSEVDGDDRIYTDYKTPPLEPSREVSWYSNGSVKTQKAAFAIARKPLPQCAVVATPPRRHRDASTVAAEYISELPTSPYGLKRSISEGSLPLIETLAPTVSEQSIHLEHDRDDTVLSRSSSFTTQSHRSGSPVSLISDTGSVWRTTTKRTELDDHLFDDETMGDSITPDLSPKRRSLESIQSWHSPMKPDYERNEAFESAVEFQPYNTPYKSPMRLSIKSPVGQRVISPLFAPLASVERLRLPQQEQAGKSDSGYSSNNSVRSLSGDRGKPDRTNTLVQTAESLTPTVVVRTAQPQAGVAAKFFKPILKSRKTAPAVPTFQDIRPVPRASTTSISDSNKTDAEKEKPKPKKLQKRNLIGKKKSLFVQSVQSVDDLTIPSVTPEMSANLHVRTQELPELEKTFRSMHHVRNKDSMSTMNLDKLDIRFPSPTPESEQALQRPKRKNSGGRRTSWFGKAKASESKQHPDMSERDTMAMINDFGTVASSLGRSPYDFAHGQSQISTSGNGKLNAYNISTKAPRPRSMFDDETAAEIARLRSSSIKERDARNERRTPFNDRGGIPGKNLRPTSMAIEAPPMPALPRQNTHQNREIQPREPEVEVALPPLPPKHSPRPVFIEHADYFEEQHVEEEFAAPPPPSHSPRPIDISPRPSPCASPRLEQRVQDPWAAQAEMWKARRQSAGEALKRQSWHEADYHMDEHAVEEEPLYPSIPERNPTIHQNRFAHTRQYSIQPVEAQDQHHYNGPQPSQNRRFPMLPSQQQIPYQHHDFTFQTQPYQPDPYEAEHRPLPPGPQNASKSPYPSPHASRPTSRHSARSYASSMAEELHPENYAEQRRPQPAPDFGRYSGGLGYGYEGKDKGFAGSAGTRTVSGKADGMWKGVELRGQYGVDLGDVPVIGIAMPREDFRKSMGWMG